MSTIFLSVLVASSVEAAIVAAPNQGKKASLTLINPKLEDVKSDKKFFGPPFPADYPDDQRPTMKPDILRELKENNKPYPYLQNRKEFDADYVKDENGDKGDWKAQFDYDAYRKLLGEEEAKSKRAQDEADKEGRDEDAAKKAADDAAKNEKDAQKELDDTKNGGNDDGKGGKGDGAGGDALSAEEKKKLEEMQKKVKEAEDNYEKAKKQFAECQRQLDAAQKEVEDLKKQLAEYEDYAHSQSKLWSLKKDENKKVRQSNKDAAAAKVKLAEARLDVALEVKKEREESLTKEKAEHAAAEKVLQAHVAKMEQAKKKLEAARLHLQTLRGYKMPTPAPAKSGVCLSASIVSVFWIVFSSVATHLY